MTILFIALALAGAAVPHRLRLDRSPPAAAAALWSGALALRSLVSVWLVATVLLVVPSTALFRTLTHWCRHIAVPQAGVHVDVHGHDLGAISMLAPAVLLGASLLVALWATAGAARRIRRDLRATALGGGPSQTLMVGGSEVVFAAVGLLRPRIVVSTGAPARLDDDELAAGLAHEEGHVRRRHHHVLLYAEACRALSAWLPGTRRAVAELRFHLERDADDWALRSHDPLALASAICKAASPAEGTSPLAASLSGSAVLRRVDLLMEATNAGTRTRRGGLNVAAALMTCLVIASVIALPAQAVNRDGSGVPEHGVHHCDD